MKQLFLTVAAVTLVVSGCSAPEPETAEKYSDRVKASCDEEYGADTQASVQCQMQLMLEKLDEGQDAQMDRARRGV
jgi:PBP1b-binding outer membrane lipoprotein LpoB